MMDAASRVSAFSTHRFDYSHTLKGTMVVLACTNSNAFIVLSSSVTLHVQVGAKPPSQMPYVGVGLLDSKTVYQLLALRGRFFLFRTLDSPPSVQNLLRIALPLSMAHHRTPCHRIPSPHLSTLLLIIRFLLPEPPLFSGPSFFGSFFPLIVAVGTGGPATSKICRVSLPTSFHSKYGSSL